MAELKIRIAEARSEDIGRGICRIDPDLAKSLKITTGNIVEIKFYDKKTVAKSWHGYPDDRGKNIIRIDEQIRKNIVASIDDEVSIRRITAKDAVKISFSPTDPLRIQGGEAYLRRILENRAITEGDYIDVPIMGRKIVLKVIDHIPKADAVVVRDTTTIEINYNIVDQVSKRNFFFKNILGLDSAIEKIKDTLFHLFQNNSQIQNYQFIPSNRILLIGPTGSGKSLLANALANELECVFSEIAFYDIYSKYWGESEKIIKNVFKEAERSAPIVLFIDQIEFFLANDEDVETLTDLRIKRNMIDALKRSKNIEGLVVIAACHESKVIDKNIRYMDIFDQIIKLNLPNKELRYKFLRHFSKNMPLDEKIDLNIVAEKTEGCVAAALETIINKAFRNAIKNSLKDQNEPKISISDINNALKELLAENTF